MIPLVNNDCYISHTSDKRYKEKKAHGSRKGGRVKSHPDRVGEWTSRSIETTEDLWQGLSEEFDQCMLGKVSTSQLSALSKAAAVPVRIIEPPKPEDRGDPNSLRDHLLRFDEAKHPELKDEFVAYLRAVDVSEQ
jgi:hypothetical protein